ncbi:L-aminoadipate-semialdehyde dehydrogenase-phosphopantetheinyl transferase isoform X2 [Ixodes scapularis]|uniref:L-aminoadipate-semialdehyde dehydrogenase-phosphopantetheinyl transferase isoform X2 n=1 Tax=Ixodes scapularis TaxID=6945 RepID=UPI001A9E95C1|nr:L-aminoadipate-semialdehyde dehydrogenase-phosphopantetheinyl transferase isoform X2 [Ixodes scapularis]
MNGKSVRWAFNFMAWKPTQEEWLFATRCVQSEEKCRIDKFVYSKDAKSSMIGRLLLRKCISECLEIPYEALRLGRTENNRPVVEDPDIQEHMPFDFNVSHQGDFSVLAADHYSKVGVDVMKIEYSGGKTVGEFFSLMRRQFTPGEWRFIEGPGTERDLLRRFYRLWSLKESFVKAEGVGLGIDLQRLNFVCETPEVSVGSLTKDTKLYFDGRLLTDWMFQETLLDEKHCACTALRIEDSPPPEDVLFENVTFQELVQGARPIRSLNACDWTLFAAKAESPLGCYETR